MTRRFMPEGLSTRLGNLSDVSAIVAVEKVAFLHGPMMPLDENSVRLRLGCYRTYLLIIAEMRDKIVGHIISYKEKGKL